ncbi:T9SS type A sorting domain-containing protein [Hymenobacter sp. BT175]|uniref:T9SS type A sorting domain-containing protein n=1 Tax=Hymenobacter translucens TaxID=2886507 RepID=UPI001D0E6127|nr:T9SS type A sorting domain-containing protein [Hymenobacter translucens]MCC2546631.1 T9SS type A sorting domain-containing protein [Hymenobacter translucens]
MKKHYLLASALLFASASSFAQGTELFLSEYIEGAHQSGVSYNGGVSNSTGNERAIEVFNPTTSTVNLNPYSLRRYSNGSTTVTEEERLVRKNGAPNTLNSAAAFVYANGEATLPALLNSANQLGALYQTPGPNTVRTGGIAYFNGNDAMALVRYTGATAGTGTGVIIDIFGVIGQDPGTSWSATDASGTLVTSANQSLIRRPTVSSGVRVNPQPQGTPTNPNPAGYNISTEWESYSTAFPGGVQNPGAQSYARLGEHNDYNGPFGLYGPLKTLEQFNAGISVYPNPASGTATVELTDVKVSTITVINNLGQTIMAKPQGLSTEKVSLDVSNLKAGLYFVQFISADGQTKIYKELVVQ